MDTTHDLELIYIGDPMCSWCWGFTPTLHKLKGAVGIPFGVIMGGLAAGPAARVMGESMKKTIAHHWHAVEEASGQPFDHTVLERHRDFVYDTELPCTAVVTLRAQHPDRALDFVGRLHRAFYVEGVDITRKGAYPALVEGFAQDVDAFMAALTSPEMKTQAWQDFSMSRNLGITGFPSLVIRDGRDFGIVCRGFAPYDAIAPGLMAWLDERRERPPSDDEAAQATGASCDVNGDCS